MAIVALGQANSRMKDFYDLIAQSRLFEFDGQILVAAIRATFERRETALPDGTPYGLSAAFAEDHDKVKQWSAFVERESLPVEVPNLKAAIEEITKFVSLPVVSAISGEEFSLYWTKGVAWYS